MTDPQTPVTGTGDGGVKVGRVELYSGVITTIATVILVPCFMRWMDYKEKELASRERIENKRLLDEVKADQEEIKNAQVVTHTELKQVAIQAAAVAEKAEDTAAKVEEIHQTTSAIAGALPPPAEKADGNK